MKNNLKTLLNGNFPLVLTRQHAQQIQRWMIAYETKPLHAEVLSSALIGVTRIYFHQSDSNELFNIVGIDPNEFKHVAHQSPEIDTTHIVASNPFNILVVWLTHKFAISKLSLRDKHDSQVAMLKMMQYSFYTSVVNNSFQYLADPGIMQYTIDSLSKKFYIKNDNTPTWKLVIEERCEHILSKDSKHRKQIMNFDDDKDILRVITYTQTRLRRQFVRIAHRFYENHKEGNTVKSSSLVTVIEGESVLNPLSANMSSVAHKVADMVSNPNTFIDHEYIEIAVGLNSNISRDLMTTLLVKFSQLADEQDKHGKQNATVGKGSKEILVGYRILVETIIQKTYRLCILDKNVDTGSRLEILKRSEVIYSNSRLSDTDIASIKLSIERIVEKYSNSNRTATNTSLKIAFIMYIMLLSFRKL